MSRHYKHSYRKGRRKSTRPAAIEVRNKDIVSEVERLECNRYRMTEPEIDIAFGTILKTWSGMTDDEYKKFKSIPKTESLDDNMTLVEYLFLELGVNFYRVFCNLYPPCCNEELISISKASGMMVKAAKDVYERITGVSAITPLNARDMYPEEVYA